MEIEITKISKKQGWNRPASIPTCELKHLKLSHMDLYLDSMYPLPVCMKNIIIIIFTQIIIILVVVNVQ